MTLKTEMQEAAERIQEEMEAPALARVQEIKDALAGEVAEVRLVPAALDALRPRCRALAVEALASCSDPRFRHARSALRVKVEQARQRATVLLDLLDNGGARATKKVAEIESLTWLRVASWSQHSIIRNMRDELRSLASASNTVERVHAELEQDLAEIQRLIAFGGPLAAPSAGNVLEPSDAAMRQEYAQHHGGNR